MGRSRLTGLFMVLALVASIAVSPSTSIAAPSGSACSSSVTVLRTLHIEAHPSKKKVHRGERFTVHVKVTRPAEEDPAGQGITYERPASTPAQGVTVGAAIWVGEETYFWQVGETDENGEETLTLTVPKDSEYGWALASFSARYWVKNDCPDVLEDGYRNYPRFVKIVP